MGGSADRRGLSIEEEGLKHCFSLIMHGFCSSNVLYSASLSFRMFIFLLTPVDPSDYFGSYQPVLLIKKHVILFFSLLKVKK